MRPPIVTCGRRGAPTSTAGCSASGETKCIYKTATAFSPDAMFSVDWGDGEVAMSAVGQMGQMEPGIADPYAGIGDQAATVGPMLWIRSGEDLVKIMVTGDDATAKTKAIFDMAKSRM